MQKNKIDKIKKIYNSFLKVYSEKDFKKLDKLYTNLMIEYENKI